MAGTLGHLKGALDLLLRRGALERAIRKNGTPTIMAGDVEDPEFERHLQQGPYLVFDDAARPEYKRDHRVFFFPGHPILDEAMPHLMKGLGVALAGGNSHAWLQDARWRVTRPGASARRMEAAAAPAAVAALAAGAVLGLTLSKKA